MAVKILIKRVVPENTVPGLAQLLLEMRTLTTHREGYISGETLKRFDKTGEWLVISTWRSLDDWRKWAASPERAAIQKKIDGLLGTETEYEIYIYP